MWFFQHWMPVYPKNVNTDIKRVQIALQLFSESECKCKNLY